MSFLSSCPKKLVSLLPPKTLAPAENHTPSARLCHTSDQIEIPLRRTPILEQRQLPGLVLQEARESRRHELPQLVLLREPRWQVREVAVIPQSPLAVVLEADREIRGELPLVAGEKECLGVGRRGSVPDPSSRES